MSSFRTVLGFILGSFPSWLVTVFAIAIGAVIFLLVLALIKAILDAIPFV